MAGEWTEATRTKTASSSPHPAEHQNTTSTFDHYASRLRGE